MKLYHLTKTNLLKMQNSSQITDNLPDTGFLHPPAAEPIYIYATKVANVDSYICGPDVEEAKRDAIRSLLSRFGLILVGLWWCSRDGDGSDVRGGQFRMHLARLGPINKIINFIATSSRHPCWSGAWKAKVKFICNICNDVSEWGGWDWCGGWVASQGITHNQRNAHKSFVGKTCMAHTLLVVVCIKGAWGRTKWILDDDGMAVWWPEVVYIEIIVSTRLMCLGEIEFVYCRLFWWTRQFGNNN